MTNTQQTSILITTSVMIYHSGLILALLTRDTDSFLLERIRPAFIKWSALSLATSVFGLVAEALNHLTLLRTYYYATIVEVCVRVALLLAVVYLANDATVYIHDLDSCLVQLTLAATSFGIILRIFSLTVLNQHFTLIEQENIIKDSLVVRKRPLSRRSTASRSSLPPDPEKQRRSASLSVPRPERHTPAPRRQSRRTCSLSSLDPSKINIQIDTEAQLVYVSVPEELEVASLSPVALSPVTSNSPLSSVPPAKLFPLEDLTEEPDDVTDCEEEEEASLRKFLLEKLSSQDEGPLFR